MQLPDVERIVRSVLTQYGVPFKLHSVSPLAGKWDIALHPPFGEQVHVTIYDGTPQAMRHALVTALEIDA